MSEAERKGRTIILIVAGGLIGTALLNLLGALAMTSRDAMGMAWVRLAICLVVSFLMWRGYSWARSYVAFALFVGAVLAALGSLAMLAGMFFLGLLNLTIAFFYAWGGYMLWKSPDVDAYIEWHEKARNPDMSLGGGMGA